MGSFEEMARGVAISFKKFKFKHLALNIVFPSDVGEETIQALITLGKVEYGEDNFIYNKKESGDFVEVLIFFEKEILKEADAIATPFGLSTEIIPDVMTVGVGGDNRSYTPIVNVRGPFPGNDVLEKISNQITNTLPINRVTYEVIRVNNSPTQ